MSPRRIRFSRASNWAAHNARFAQGATSADDFHVARPRGLRLDTVFRLEEKRTVSNDWVVRYDNRFFQLERQSGLAPARSTVVVCESVDGRLEIRYRDHVMRWTEIVAGALAERRAAPTSVASPAPSGPRPPRHAADHPWYQGGTAQAVFRQLAKDRRAWARVQP